MSLPDRVINALRCSVCAEPVSLTGRTLRCERRHAFDLARQGYVNLLHARIPAGTADTAPMVDARAAFLSSGAYAPLAEAVASAGSARGLIIDAGAGPGYYLSRVLDSAPDAVGLALDVSAIALRRAARAHERLGAAVWNLWEPWPVADEAASVVLDVFSPRNAAEFHRVLEPGGKLVVASPLPGHLAELGDLVLAVDARKEERLEAALGGLFVRESGVEVVRTQAFSAEQVRDVVAMGPAGFHLDRYGRRERLEAAAGRDVTLAVSVSTWRKRDDVP
ncbi:MULTISPECIES: putative RNA methyltransferase [Amycolatopsis]|uniref:rRNA (Guanine-N1)-methyltransferase n=1 Tax=Amycolatopsis dendrobii TaxID=2760662 RepID=A0A7W3W5T7_9PSEU|nr:MULTISPECIES: rRNA (guanine-N1)-methyltransferase [Amycolatopsis]MBB1158917.1 rRNA (guanine-N1)-methyltransferase [Amycolatopsis dendrobii]UKD55078.1 rRNA (guanine-N1)-methyltransferase [Amycolatopsis sp. FU40]